MSIQINNNNKQHNINNLDIEDNNTKSKNTEIQKDKIPNCLETVIKSLEGVNYDFHSTSLLSTFYSDIATMYLEVQPQRHDLALQFTYMLSEILNPQMKKEEKKEYVKKFFAELKDYDSVKQYPDYYKAVETILIEFSLEDLQQDINFYAKKEKNKKIDAFKTFCYASNGLNQSFRSSLISISTYIVARGEQIASMTEKYKGFLNDDGLAEKDVLFSQTVKRFDSGPDRLSPNEFQDLGKFYHQLNANSNQIKDEFYQQLNFYFQTTFKLFDEHFHKFTPEIYRKAIETNDLKTLKKFHNLFDELEKNLQGLSKELEVLTVKYLEDVQIMSNLNVYFENVDSHDLKELFKSNKKYQSFYKELRTRISKFKLDENIFQRTPPANKFIIESNQMEIMMVHAIMQALRVFYTVDNSQTFKFYHSLMEKLKPLIMKQNTKMFFAEDIVQAKPNPIASLSSNIEAEVNKNLDLTAKVAVKLTELKIENKLDVNQTKQSILINPNKIKFMGAAAEKPFENAQLYLSNLLSLWERIKQYPKKEQSPTQIPSHVINTVINSNLALEQMYTSLIAQRFGIQEQKKLQEYHSHDLIALYNYCDFKGVEGFTKDDLNLLVAANRSEILSRNIPTNLGSYNTKIDRAKDLMDQAFQLAANPSSVNAQELLQKSNKYSLDVLKSLIHLHRFFTDDLSDNQVIKNLEELYLESKTAIPNIKVKSLESESKYPKVIAYLEGLSKQYGMSCQDNIENLHFLLSMLECETNALQNAEPHELSLIHSRVLQLNQIIVEEMLYLILETKGIYPKKSDIDHNLKQLINGFDFKIKFTAEENKFLEEGKKIRSITRYGVNNNNNNSVTKSSKKSRRLAKQNRAKQEVAEGFSPVQTAQDKQALADMAKIKESIEADCKIFRSVIAKIIG